MNRALKIISIGAIQSPRWAALALGALLLVTARPARAAGTNAAAAPFRFRVGMAKICFNNVNREDAIAAHKVLLESTGSQFGTALQAETRIFDDTPSFEAAIQGQTMQLAILDAWQFLTMDIHQQMKPFYLVMANGKVAERFLVLTRRDSGLNTLAALRGKSMLKLEVASSNVAKFWLESLLLAGKLGHEEAFFASMEVVPKATAAVLPVFFGKKSACVVDESSFDLMKELNPQVGQQLQIMAVSEPFANPVVCLNERGWRSGEEKNAAIRALNELHLNPVGQQTCTLFKIDRLVPFEDAQLDTVRKMQAACAALRKAGTP